MIELKKLRKVYRSLRGGRCVALNDVDLKLPDTGLVFIIGKSGSGKSTLLNLLGGLDTITGGDIIADGNSLASFGRQDFEKYRSSYIGFVFQHYYLLEELTVAENVRLAMSIVGKDDEDEVKRLLDKVGLSGFEKRYPKELSGGQQQRVAIARALAKDPKLILGDELTGNLDHKTSVEILTVLKEISREKLVVVVSHNLDEADMFADRIIELHDGEVIRDRIRVANDQKQFFVKNKVAYMPYFRDLTKKEVQHLEHEMRNGNIRDIVQQDDGFALNTRNVNSDRQIELKNRKFLKKAKRKYTSIFVKKGFMTKLVTVVIMTLMLLCIAVLSSLEKMGRSDVKYETGEAFVALNKMEIESSDGGLFEVRMFGVSDEDYAIAGETLGGKVHRIYNLTLRTSPLSTVKIGGMYQGDIKRNIDQFYVEETYGTLVCDMEFLTEKYGSSGELSVLAGEITVDSSKLIITDYVADAFLNLYSDRYSSYEDIIEGEPLVGAIIGTDYKTRYASIISKYKSGMSEEELSDLYNSLIKSELYRSFQSEVIYSLGVTYSVNPDFIESYLDTHADKKCSVRDLSFVKDGVEYPEDATTTCGFSKNDPNKVQEHPAAHYLVNRGEIKIPYSVYNKIFGTNYSLETLDTFVPHEVTIRVHDRSIGDTAVIFEKTYKVVSILSSNIQMHEDDFNEIRGFSLKSFGLYLENNENVAETVALMNEREMVPKTIAFESVTGINKMLSIFIPFFKLIGGGLYAFIVIYLVNYAISNIKKNYFQIGVMRSFGAKSLDVGVIFITGVVLTGIAIVVLMIALEPLIVEVYNKILVESFSIVLNTYPHDISIVRLSPWTPVINSVLVLFTTFMSALISVIVLRRLKPIEIIRAKDNGGEVS